MTKYTGTTSNRNLTATVERKTQLKLLGVTNETDPMNWDTHIDHVLSKVSSPLCILRVCKFYGYPKEQLDLLFRIVIMSVFTYATSSETQGQLVGSIKCPGESLL